MATIPAFTETWSDAGRNASPAAKPITAAVAIAARKERSRDRRRSDSSGPFGILGDSRHEESLTVECLDDRENRDEHVEREHDPGDGTEKKKTVAGMPPDLRVIPREQQRDHPEKSEVGEDEHRARRNRPCVRHARDRTIAADRPRRIGN